jgi:hypothetical protein
MCDKIFIIESVINLIDNVDEFIYCNQTDDCELTILKTVLRNFLIKNCEHTIIKDYIDIDQEHSQTIHYCSKCYSTM